MMFNLRYEREFLLYSVVFIVVDGRHAFNGRYEWYSEAMLKQKGCIITDIYIMINQDTNHAYLP